MVKKKIDEKALFKIFIFFSYKTLFMLTGVNVHRIFSSGQCALFVLSDIKVIDPKLAHYGRMQLTDDFSVIILNSGDLQHFRII